MIEGLAGIIAVVLGLYVLLMGAVIANEWVLIVVRKLLPKDPIN